MEMTQNRGYPSVREITDIQRIRLVKEIFSTISTRYDFLNRFLSFRRDVVWRRCAVDRMRFFSTRRFLDVATGTGDLAIEAARSHSAIRVIGLDFVAEMMAPAKPKIRGLEFDRRIDLVRGDAMHLPFPAASVDVAAVAFGIRNMPDRLSALREMARVVVPGGQVMVLEMTFPESRLFQKIYDIYLNRLLPGLARLFSPNPAAYRYLADSIMNFPTPTQFSALMKQAGLIDVTAFPLTLGVTQLHVGRRPEAAAS
jgi:demethylmenaquinone methyltransferase/2-methoxy-6-polyprenyl-1,4-benzoquinol methylase